MSDPNYTDPRFSPPPHDDIRRDQRLGELEASNAMWGWIAGGVVLALLLLFVFGRAPNTSDTASIEPPAASTTLAPPRTPAQPPTANIPRQPPSTTGQGGSQQ